jgi:cysteine desulfurase
MRHYLDYNATAPVRPEVAAVMQELLPLPLNASSVHASGRRARSLIEDARRTIGEAVGAFANEVVFTGSGTEANNWVLRALKSLSLFVSAIEHSSVLTTARAIGTPDILPVTKEGVLDLEASDALLPQDEPFLVSLMLANNETGVIQPVRELADRVHAKGGLLHCDAVQAFGKIPVDFTTLGCDLMTVSAHKMGGPVGAAALIVKSSLTFAPLLTGGGQEMNRRAGTENVAAIAGFEEAVKRIDLAWMQPLRLWRDAMEAEIKAASGGSAPVFGESASRLPNTSLIAMPGVSSETQLIRFDLEGIEVSAGSACSSGRIEPSHVLRAMGVEEGAANSALRISGGWGASREDFEAAAAAWKALFLSRKHG